MSTLSYCLQCRRVFKGEDGCPYCKSNSVKELSMDSPVNVLGSKLKGKVLKIEDGKARLLIRDENNGRYIKEYEADKLRKIL